MRIKRLICFAVIGMMCTSFAVFAAPAEDGTEGQIPAAETTLPQGEERQRLGGMGGNRQRPEGGMPFGNGQTPPDMGQMPQGEGQTPPQMPQGEQVPLDSEANSFDTGQNITGENGENTQETIPGDSMQQEAQEEISGNMPQMPFGEERTKGQQGLPQAANSSFLSKYFTHISTVLIFAAGWLFVVLYKRKKY